MNIVFKASEPDILEYMRGIGQHLSYCGYNVIEWKNKSAFDIFDELHPDLLIVDEENYPTKPLKENPQTKVVVVCEHRYFNEFADAVISTKVNTPFSFLPKACNQFNYIDPKYNKMFDCDVLYIGNHHPVIDQICSIQNNLNIKLFGNCPGTEYYCGYISQKLIGDAFHTPKTVIHLHENECSQQLFDALYCEANVISDMSETTLTLFPNIEFLPEEDFIIPKLYEKKLSNSFYDYKSDIISDHTYFHRCISLFEMINIDTTQIKNGHEKFNKYIGL